MHRREPGRDDHAPNADWNGFERSPSRATDPGGLSDSDPATFTVTAVNDAPVVADIPDQTVAEGWTFVTIPLDSYVTDVDNTDAQMAWTCAGNSRVDGFYRRQPGRDDHHSGRQLERLRNNHLHGDRSGRPGRLRSGDIHRDPRSTMRRL